VLDGAERAGAALMGAGELADGVDDSQPISIDRGSSFGFTVQTNSMLEQGVRALLDRQGQLGYCHGTCNIVVIQLNHN